MISTILIIGGGQAGAQAIDTLRREGFKGRLVLVGDEPELPYQRPPLSKKFLSGELAVERLPFRHQSFYDEHQIELKLGVSATRIDAAARKVVLSNGEEIVYDRLLLCLGATSRQLTCPGADLPGVRYLRSIADVPKIQEALKAGARAVVIGGGYIGLETAATARKMGCAVTVLEMADRLMNRVVASNVSEYFAHEHRSQGVKIICNTRVVRLEGSGRVERVVCADGSTYEADLLVVGVGAVANMQLASDAGLACENGIMVDEYCRTSDPAIYAAGDCTYHPSLRFEMRVRLESVDNAFEQAKAAALNILERPTIHDRVPWFWSDQYDNKLLIVGLSQGHDQQLTRGDPATRSFSVCYLRGGELLAVEAINHSKDYMAARKLIADRARPNLDKLADPLVALREAV
ncbi:MAG: 3-phenylpropionate/trans-cinnamate dioxygenase ferredoxin reductase component [Gammaproteobacteria bacterium]|jgi:3-phenylpropionate/trans-cinnamate dioxygenase ferredoxin reductase subunit|nr:3-phenylpropionate/trans-cinnamate dioxygenase ferredoxin reductase component [Gammaproteobacteria bacterium]